MQNPTPDEMTKMIEAIFTKTDSFRTQHGLDAPADKVGFIELLRLVFNQDDQGKAIFQSMDDTIFEVLYDMYKSRQTNEARYEVDSAFD